MSRTASRLFLSAVLATFLAASPAFASEASDAMKQAKEMQSAWKKEKDDAKKAELKAQLESFCKSKAELLLPQKLTRVDMMYAGQLQGLAGMKTEAVATIRKAVESKEEIAAVRQGLGMLVTIGGTVAGAVLVTRLGLRRSLWVLAALQALSNLAFSWLALAGPDVAALTAAVVVENFCAGLVTAGFVGFLTAQCDPRYAAFQYALLSALMAALRLVGAPAGFAAEALGWPAYFVATALLGLPGMLLLPWIGTRVTPPTSSGLGPTSSGAVAARADSRTPRSGPAPTQAPSADPATAGNSATAPA